MSRARTIAALIALAALVGVGAGGWSMARRVAAFNSASTRELFVFMPVNTREFRFAGRDVTMTDERDENGRDWVVLRYGPDEARLLASIPPGPAELPGLLRHDDWLRVLRFVPRRGIAFDELERRVKAGEIADRLVVVTRNPRAGADPTTYGEVARSDWTFEFYELLAETGGFTHQRLRFPETARSLRRRQNAARDKDKAIPERRDDELKHGTWEFEAAMFTMPAGWLSAPGGGEAPPTFAGDAVHALGWTLPVTSISFVAFALAAAALASARRRPDLKGLGSDQRPSG
jgi:hypothetical protein